MLASLMAEIGALRAAQDRGQQMNARCHAEIESLKAELVQARNTPPAPSNSNLPIPSIETLFPGSRATTHDPSRQFSAAPSGFSLGGSRLTKNVPESDSLDDGTDPTFRQWKASLQDKFRENSDHFVNERSRCTHVWLKTKGLARSYLTPRYTSETQRFTSTEEMLECLETYFLTGTEQEEARNRFNDMCMQEPGYATESFPEFKARFIADAIEGGVPQSEWFFNMWNKIIPRLRIQNLGFKAMWNDNFSTLVSHLTRVEMERARPSNRTPANRLNTSSSSATATASRTTPGSAKKTSTATKFRAAETPDPSQLDRTHSAPAYRKSPRPTS